MVTANSMETCTAEAMVIRCMAIRAISATERVKALDSGVTLAMLADTASMAKVKVDILEDEAVKRT